MDNIFNKLRKLIERLILVKAPTFSWRSPFWQLLLLATLALFLVFVFIIMIIFFNTKAETKYYTIKVHEGMSAYEIGAMLEKNGIIVSPLLFRIEAKLTGVDSQLKAGRYRVSDNMNSGQIILILKQQPLIGERITIPEGFTVDNIADELNEKGYDGMKFRNLAKSYHPFSYISVNSEQKYDCEGFLFPDTYDLADENVENDLLQRMTKRFDYKLTTTMREQIAQKGLSIEQLIIMASLIEKEAKTESDRPIVASVFYNRIKRNMPLQSCATIQYIIGYPKPELSIADTEIDSPYNTYIYYGLPPGPICNPGDASINAALYPAQSDYLYFVVNGKGGHYFSKTYEEHMAYINAEH